MARIDGNYAGNDAVDVPEPIDVDWIEIDRDFTPDVPGTVVLPFALPEGTEIKQTFRIVEKELRERYERINTF